MYHCLQLIGSVALVEACVVHHQLPLRFKDCCFRSVLPVDCRARVTIRLTNELLRRISEHQDRLWKLCGIDFRFICKTRGQKQSEDRFCDVLRVFTTDYRYYKAKVILTEHKDV